MDNKERSLHFDVSLGCTANALIGALADLVDSNECIKAGLSACGVIDVEPVIRREKTKTTSGVFVDLSDFPKAGLGTLTDLPRRDKRRPFWARSRKAKKSNESEETTSETWLNNESLSALDLKRRIEASDLHPISKALALKVANVLIEALEKSGSKADSLIFNGQEATQVLIQIVAFAQLITVLNPSGVTASHVALSLSDKDADRRSLLYALTQEVPVVERVWPAPYADYVGLALLLSVTSRFGARGESIIERAGVGLEASNDKAQAVVRALLCHVESTVSRSVSTSHANEVLPQVEVTAILGHGVDVADLMRRIQGFGMRQVYTWQAFEASTYPRMMLRGVLPHSDVETAIEAILVTGEAIELSTQSIETQKLHQRTVSVPFGRGQKMQACRVNEFVWSGKVLRADPDQGDLAILAQATGFAQDVLRADVLAAWRKFRRPS